MAALMAAQMVDLTVWKGVEVSAALMAALMAHSKVAPLVGMRVDKMAVEKVAKMAVMKASSMVDTQADW